jgi:ribonuclease-3
VPDYEVAAVRGEAHLQTFDVVCRIPALDISATGSGTSRRAAEQAAAAAAYDRATGA